MNILKKASQFEFYCIANLTFPLSGSGESPPSTWFIVPRFLVMKLFINMGPIRPFKWNVIQ